MKLPIANCQLPIAREIAAAGPAGRPHPEGPKRPRCLSIFNRQSSIGNHAFTLIEIMVAVMLFSLVVGSIYATFALVLRSSQVGQEAAAQAQRQRVVLRAIGDALMGIESFQASQKYYWFKLQNGQAPLLTFVARLPDTFPRNGKFVGAAGGRDASTRRVLFSLADGTDGEKDLVLQQQPILMDMDEDEQKYPLVLAKNVKDFAIEWWGTNEMGKVDWFQDWDDKQTNTIPQMVRVHLVLGANADKGNNGADFVATRIYTVPSEMMPAMVQMGTGGQRGPNNSPIQVPIPQPGGQNGGQIGGLH